MTQTTRRRRFLQALAGAPLLPAVLAEAQTAPAAPPPSPPPDGKPGPQSEALTEAARQRFGAHIRPADVEEVKKAIQGNLDAAQRLRVVKLTNGDDPVTIFEARPRRSRSGQVSTGRGGRPVRRLEFDERN